MSLRLLLYVIDVFKTSFVRYGYLKDVSEMACVCSINDRVFTKPHSVDQNVEDDYSIITLKPSKSTTDFVYLKPFLSFRNFVIAVYKI